MPDLLILIAILALALGAAALTACERNSISKRKDLK